VSKVPEGMNNVTVADEIYAILGLLARPADAAGMIKYKLMPKGKNLRSNWARGDANVRDGVIEFDYNGRNLRFFDNNLDTSLAMEEIFERDTYSWLDVKGRAVLDIGGFIGDTAIYFSVKGAREIWTYEPVKKYCQEAGKNLRLNDVTNVKLHNEPASSKTIDRFAMEFKGRAKALKIECEGGEYEMVLKAKTLGDYDQIMIEYHYGYLDLAQKLRNENFVVEATRPKLDLFNKRMGFIYARKKKR
jgi:hypothetical protein